MRAPGRKYLVNVKMNMDEFDSGVLVITFKTRPEN